MNCIKRNSPNPLFSSIHKIMVNGNPKRAGARYAPTFIVVTNHGGDGGYLPQRREDAERTNIRNAPIHPKY